MSHQDRALELLLSGKTALETAALVGVDARTIRRWKKETSFAQELSDLREEIRDEIMLRVMALIEKLQSAAFAQLEWLKTMADKLPALTDKLRCLNAISQLNFKWSKFIMDRQDRLTVAQFARATQPAKKADTNGQDLGAKEQTAVSFAPCCEAKPTQKADANGHDRAIGATDAPTAVPSVHPCPDDSPTQKADVNGHRPATPSKTVKKADPSGTDESGIRHPDASVAPRTPLKADENGHATPADPELAALAAHRAQLATSKPTQKADKDGHATWKGKGSSHVPFYKNIARR